MALFLEEKRLPKIIADWKSMPAGMEGGAPATPERAGIRGIATASRSGVAGAPPSSGGPPKSNPCLPAPDSRSSDAKVLIWTPNCTPCDDHPHTILRLLAGRDRARDRHRRVCIRQPDRAAPARAHALPLRGRYLGRIADFPARRDGRRAGRLRPADRLGEKRQRAILRAAGEILRRARRRDRAAFARPADCV